MYGWCRIRRIRQSYNPGIRYLFCLPQIAQNRATPSSYAHGRGGGFPSVKVSLLRRRKHLPPPGPAGVVSMSCHWLRVVCSIQSITLHILVRLRQGTWWLHTTRFSFPVPSWSGLGLQGQYAWLVIPRFSFWGCSPSPQRRGPEGTPPRVHSTPAESTPLVSGWRTAKIPIPTPVGYTSAGTCKRPAGTCVPPSLASESLLPNPTPYCPATASVDGRLLYIPQGSGSLWQWWYL